MNSTLGTLLINYQNSYIRNQETGKVRSGEQWLDYFKKHGDADVLKLQGELIEAEADYYEYELIIK